MSYGEMEHHRWEHSLLSEESVAFLRSLTKRIDFISEGMSISVMHSCMDKSGHYSGSVRNPTEHDIARVGVLTIEDGKADIEPVDVRYDLNYPEADVVKEIFYGL